VGGWLTGTGCKRATTAAIGVLAAAAAVAAAGCSGTVPTPARAAPVQTTPAQEVELAAATAAGVNSFTATISMDLFSKGTSAGAVSVSVAGRVSEVVHPSPLVEFTFSTLKAAGASLPGGMSEIVTPNELYVKLTELSMLLHTDKQWLGLPVSTLSSGSGLDLGSLFGESATSNPLTMTQLLAGATDVKTVGPGTVDGVPVTEYTGSYSLANALGTLPASTRSSVSSAFKQAGLDSGTAGFTVWIDAQHIARKDVTVLTSSTFSETLTTTVTSVNQPVTIAPPIASQVFTLSAADLSSAIT